MKFHPITPPWDVRIAGARPQSNRCVAEKKKGNDMEVGPSVVLNVAKLNCSNINRLTGWEIIQI